MKKRNANELNREELTKVYNANEKLQYDIGEDMIESEMFYIGEQLDYLRSSLSDWSIGAYNRNYVSVRDNVGFINGMIEMDENIPLLTDDQTKILDDALKLKNEYMNTDVHTDEFDKVEEELDSIVSEIANLVASRFTEILDGCYNKEYQIDYLVEFYADSRLEDCYIIDEDGDYVLHEDISYIKKYN